MAEDEDDASKTEEPTSKRLSKAREEGNVPISKETQSWFMIFAGLILLWALLPSIMRNITMLLRKYIGNVHEIPTDTFHLIYLLKELFLDLGWILIIPAGMFILLALLSVLTQVGFLYAPKKMEPKLSTLNPLKGFSKLMSVKKIIEAFFGFVKLAAIIGGSWLVVKPRLEVIPALPSMGISAILDQLYEIILLLVVVVIMVMIVVAVIDISYTRYSHNKKLKMTKQEVKDEHKQSEGDPQVKARIRSIRMERFRQNMLKAVESADVVVTNPSHYAVALVYNMEAMDAPKVVAKGLDFLALKLKEIAAEHEVPIVENPPLARALYASAEVNEFIPPEHFKAVAEVIGYVMRLKKQVPS